MLPCIAAPKLYYKIYGLDKGLLKKVSSQLELKKETIIKYTEEEIAVFYQDLPEEIAKILKLYGYFKARISAGKIHHHRNKWFNTFLVKLGPKLRITKIELKVLGEGVRDKNIKENISKFPLKVGEVFLTDRYNSAKKFLFDLADNNGYSAASLEVKRILVDLKHNTAEIVLHFATGPQYYFGHTDFKVPYFSKRFLAKFIPYQRGEIYTSKKLYAFQDALNNTNLFQRIVLNPKFAKDNYREIPIEISLIPRKVKQYTIGAGYSTDTGIRGSVGMELRYLTKTAHSMKGQIRASQLQKDFELHYFIPGKNPLNDAYDFSVAGKSFNHNNDSSNVMETGFSYITRVYGWQQTTKLSLQHEYHKIEFQPYKSTNLLIPSITWSRNHSDDPIRPLNGYNINISFRGASKYLLAKDNFFQAQVDAKYISKLTSKIHIVLHGATGYTNINEINNLPLALQFYVGGTQSIRGFGYNVIGPGRNFMIGGLELRHKIIGDWYLATFFDIGNTSDDLFSKLHRGVGVGIVYRSSIGVLELTYAKAISLPTRPGRVQFSLRPDL